MESITQMFSQEHSRCDKQFAQIEANIAKNKWEPATKDFTAFINAMSLHFSMEEQILFPTIEERTGQTAGPTQVMRMEHQQMRQVFAEMQNSVNQQNREEYLGLSETLLMLMQQHNAKEEQILYPMSDQVLGDDVPSILNQMRALGDIG